MRLLSDQSSYVNFNQGYILFHCKGPYLKHMYTGIIRCETDEFQWPRLPQVGPWIHFLVDYNYSM